MRRKSARSASGRVSPLWNDRRLAVWMNFMFSGTGNILEARSGVRGAGAADAGAGASGIVCWLRVLRRFAEGGPADVGSGAGGEKESAKSSEESWRAERAFRGRTDSGLGERRAKTVRLERRVERTHLPKVREHA
eukprot:3204624-Pleurochrysis_carterae.AAC.1